MLVAGWQFGVSGVEAPFSEKEVALEKAIAGSGSGNCYQRMVICNGHYTAYHCDGKFTSETCRTYEYGCLFC